jgi:16S rRNA (guanine1516-N2)-methyltransferase|tara:strand:- start:27 stop:926 length:900 start_codon:yes stop_codon:yes gene_type:complete
MTEDSMPIIRVAYAAASFKALAETLAEKLSLPLQGAGYNNSEGYDYLLEFTEQGLVLRPSADKGYGSILCDFASSEHSHRRRHGGGNGQAIAKAVGVSGKFAPQVLDLTAGLGGDGFVLASLGCKVCMLERNPIVHSLLADGLSRGVQVGREDAQQGDDELEQVISRLSLLEGNAASYLSDLVDKLVGAAREQGKEQGKEQPKEPENEVWRPDIVYVDPMFPLRKKSAKVKKEMQAFHAIVGTDPDADDLLANALAVAQYRVVVKRPAGAGFLAETKPNYSLEGKSTRYDIYALKKLPI